MGVDPNHQLTRMRPTTNGRGRFADYMLRGGAGPLLVATLSYDDVAIKALLAHGAEPDLPNVYQLTPLMLAAGSNDEIRIMQRTQPDLQARAIKVVGLLLDAGANVNYRVTDSHTHTAQVAGRRGDAAEAEGQTALMAAARLGWDQMVKHLLERGADPTLRDATGRTALDFARPPAPEAGRRQGPADPGRTATVEILAAAAPKS
jgi:ankyrin repeat protein